MTIRRIFLILLLHFIIMVCFPYFGDGAWFYALKSCLIWGGAAILIGIVFTILGLEKWERLNLLITFGLSICCLWFLLNYFPQKDNISPMKKIAYGDLPKLKDIKHGLANFGITWKNVKDTTKDLNKKVQEGAGALDLQRHSDAFM